MENVRHFPPRDHNAADEHGYPEPPPEDEPHAFTTAPPHDLEAERLVLGAAMVEAAAYTNAATIIDRADLYHRAHQLLWDVVGQLITDGKPVHPVAVRASISSMGRLREIEDGRLIDSLTRTTITPSMVGHFADLIAERARERRYDEHASNIKGAIARAATADELDNLVSQFQQAETLRTNTGHGPAHLTSALLNWDQFFATDFGTIKLLPGRLMAPGQQIALVGDGKAGKSLFAQEWMWRMATGQPFLDDAPGDPVPVLYLDAENGQEQVQSRFLSFGAGPGRMGQLTYASFPPVRPLDTAGGGADLMSLIKATGATLVVIDTVSRFISGPENEADTWLSLYRHTLLPMKRDRIASVRLDHLGKDGERGARGSSAKNQDVDHVWTLSAQGGGILALTRTHTRTGIGPDAFTIRREARRDGDDWMPGYTTHRAMAYEHIEQNIPGSDEHIIMRLDAEAVPNDAGVRTVKAKLAELKIPAGTDKVTRIVKARQNRRNSAASDVPPPCTPDPFPDMYPGYVPGNTHGNNETAGQTYPGYTEGTSGTPLVPPVPPSLRRDGEGTPPNCLICLTPIHDPQRLQNGHDTHRRCPTNPHTTNEES